MIQFDFTKEYILENDLARLIPLKKEHFTVLKAIANTPEIWTYFLENGLGETHFQTYFANALQQRVKQKEYPFVVFDKSKQRYAGMTRLYDYLPNLERIKLGHTWYGKVFQGTGLNKNCKYLLFEFAFEQLKIHRIGFGVHSENIRSLMALKSVGVQREGKLREFLLSVEDRGKADLIHLSILKKEWFAKVKATLGNKINQTMQTKKLIKKNEGENYNYSQDHCFIKLSSKDTNGELCLIEDTLKPGFHLKRHHHKIMTEVFYMLVGEMELIFDDETIILRTGDTMTVPTNVWHEAKCAKGGKMLTIFKNGRFDIYLEELSKMTNDDFSNEEFIKSVSAKFDIYEE